MVNSQSLSAAPDANSGGYISLRTNTAITQLGGPLTIDVRGAGNDRGGQIAFELRSTDLVTLGTGGQFILNGGSSGVGAGGYIEAKFGGDLILNAGAVISEGAGESTARILADGDITVNSGALSLRTVNGNGSFINLGAGQDGSGVLALNDRTFFQFANGNGTDSNGGALELYGSNILTPGVGNSAANPLVLTAFGTGNGSGGSVTFSTANSTQMFVGQPAKAPKVRRFLSLLMPLPVMQWAALERVVLLV